MTPMEQNRIEIESLLEMLNTAYISGFKLRGITMLGGRECPAANC